MTQVVLSLSAGSFEEPVGSHPRRVGAASILAAVDYPAYQLRGRQRKLNHYGGCHACNDCKMVTTLSIAHDASDPGYLHFVR